MTEIDTSRAVDEQQTFYHSPSAIYEVDLSAESPCKRPKVRRLCSYLVSWKELVADAIFV